MVIAIAFAPSIRQRSAPGAIDAAVISIECPAQTVPMSSTGWIVGTTWLTSPMSVEPATSHGIDAVFDDTSVSEIFGGENQA